ncbi:hypothetical protein ACFVXE_08175 [Streptomyces sp. NPDC058231]|uniref:hypothetical protein n=1 Tax=Streptomyces sp. NPDC058231 TaxID=3346392 RepID=UPI0036E2DC99
MTDRIPLDDLTSDQLDQLYDERNAALERLNFLDLSMMPDMRRRTASDAAAIKRWRDRAEQAEAAIDRVRALVAEMRTWVLPHSQLGRYVDRTLAALDQPQQPAPEERAKLREQYGQVLRRWGLLDEVNDPQATEEFAVTDLLAVPTCRPGPYGDCRNCHPTEQQPITTEAATR